MAKKMSLRAAYIGFGKGFEEMKSEVLELREENKRLRAALELYRGQIDNAGKHSAADALSSNKLVEGAEGCLQPKAPSRTKGSA